LAGVCGLAGAGAIGAAVAGVASEVVSTAGAGAAIAATTALADFLAAGFFVETLGIKINNWLRDRIPIASSNAR
jgi:hypothetical protein